MILLVGAKGSMGKRYQSILRFLGKDFIGVDKETDDRKRAKLMGECDGVIIATPTESHENLIAEMAPFKKPILCEKPVTKDLGGLIAVTKRLETEGTPFRMMFQYSMLVNPNRIGKTLYNYFRHGQDGIMWDCLQVIGLARGECVLKEDSPVWACMINGQRLSIADMDSAYIAYVQKWFTTPHQDLGAIRGLHERVHEAIASRKDEYGHV